jgi:hypothetical protein
LKIDDCLSVFIHFLHGIPHGQPNDQRGDKPSKSNDVTQQLAQVGDDQQLPVGSKGGLIDDVHFDKFND